jgi:DNA helicase-2/ATP-dependent DNA helicase PcrA
MINLDILNSPQNAAVTTTEGPVLVLAGAGSGKTRVLTYRIAYILDAGLAGPYNILAMTFTNKAAAEMKERVVKLLNETEIADFDEGKSMPWMGTFHSICVKILRQHGEYVGLGRNFTIYDSIDSLAVVKEAMKRENVSIKEFNPHAIRSYISSAKNELITPTDYANYAQGYFQQIVASIYPVYQKILRENNAVDFDDLLILVVKLLTENQNVLEYYQNLFRYILVDEYQDTNHAQYMIITKLAAKNRNICCVGDDDQSIYAFRGATIKNILNFEKDYPESVVIKLEQNYRSTKKILEASHNVISKNRSRKEKKLWTENVDGENILLYTAKDQNDEASWIVEKIKNLGVDFNEIAVLYRTNAQSRSLEEAFLQGGIPYKVVGNVKFYDRKEIKDIISYLKLIYNPKDKQSLERIINVPKRGVGPKTYANLNLSAEKEGLGVLEYMINFQGELDAKLKDFAILMETLIAKSKQLNIVDLVSYLLDKSGYVDMLSDGTLENESRIENLKELITVASKFSEMEPFLSLEAFLEEVSLVTEGYDDDEASSKVTLMTIHAAKGLEFLHVFVAGAEENLFPHVNSMMEEKELEEERRLAYVAITRAKNRLYLTHAKSRIYFGQVQNNPLSRFIEDIDSNLLDHETSDGIYDWDSDMSNYADSTESVDWRSEISLDIGDFVKHEYFGKGKVVDLDDSYVRIDFGGVYGVKELMLEYAKLEKVNK